MLTCRGIGLARNYDNRGPVLCCWDGVSPQTECTDVTPSGGRCPRGPRAKEGPA
jgi:hypothetical protein